MNPGDTMLMKRAKTIDELYDEVKDYDLVIVNDISLCTALNARVKRPMLGQLCMTARNIARMLAIESIGASLINDMELIRAVSEDSGIHDLRFVHGEIQNIREMLRYTAEPQKFLHSRRSMKVYESFSRMPTLEQVMTGFDSKDSLFYSRMRKVAVIGPELFDNLDKNMNPYDAIDFIEIDPFSEDDFQIEKIYEIGNDRQIAENVVDLIDHSKATEYAIVLCTDSPIVDAVKSALYRHKIPFVNKIHARDIPQIRDYLEFIEKSLDYDVLRGRHVREIFSYFGGKILQTDDNYLLSRIPDSHIDSRGIELRDAMQDVRSITYDGLAELLMPDGSKSSVDMILDQMGIGNERISDDGYATILYLVDNIDFNHDEEAEEYERRGVLIADCMNSTYIDRPVVFYLGMGRDWNLDVSGKRYLEPGDVIDRNAMRTEILLQQGDVRMYFVNATKDGRRAEPSLVFNAIAGLMGESKEILTFDDLLLNGEVVESRRWTEGSNKGLAERGEPLADADERYMEPFSPTSFNLFMTCPKSFVLNNLIGQDDKDALILGSLIHDFAELYVTHPDFVEVKGIEYFQKIIEECYSGLSSPSLRDIDADRVHMEILGLKGFLDKNGIKASNLNKQLKKGSNHLMEIENLIMSDEICETEHVSEHHPIKGKFDLYWNGKVIDYKTGLNARTASELIKCITHQGKLKEKEFLDFQPIFYLILARDMLDSTLEFSQFYPMENVCEWVKGGYDYNRNLHTVRIVDGTVDGYIRATVLACAIENLGRELTDDEYSSLAEAVLAIQQEKDPILWRNNNDIRDAVSFELHLESKNGNPVVRKYIEMKVMDAKNRGLFASQESVTIPMETLDQFLSSIEEKHREMSAGSNSKFIREPLKDCKYCEYRAMCTRSIISSEEEVEGDD